MSWKTVESLARAHQMSPKPAAIKSQFSDFIVNEILLEPPTGSGGHLYLHIRKTNANTLWVRDRLADFAEVASRDVGYAGMKDRHGVTTQWFSVPVGAKALDWSSFSAEGVELLTSSPSRKKLQVGMLSGNQFEIILRYVQATQDELAPVFKAIAEQGVPNYFMEQRFGHGLGNLDKAMQLFERTIRVKQKKQRGLYLSAARSYLFNLVLDSRVLSGAWRQDKAGDVLDDGVVTGPMWGRGRLSSAEGVAELEMACVAEHPVFTDGLEHAGLSQDRRVLALSVQDWQTEWVEPSVLKLSFSLRSGAYATAVLREICVAL